MLTCGIDENGEIRDPVKHPEQFKQSAIGLIPKEWMVESLKDIFQIQTGATPLHEKHSEYFSGGSIPWVKTMDLNEGEIYETDEKITTKALRECSVKLLPKETILIAMYGGWEQIGRTGLLKKESTTKQTLSNLVSLRENIDCYFFLYQIQYLRYRWKIVAVSTRKDPNITKNDVENFLVAIPNENEQRLITQVIQSKNTKISQEEAYIEKLRLQKKGLMHDLLTGKVRVNHLL
ncbi:MAG: hypothetical protein RLZZ490_1121 [Cyanobacteriota bacterium]